MSTSVKVIIAAVSLVVAFAFGRFTTPEKVRIETKIVEVEKKIKNKDKRKDTKIVIITRPDGTKEETQTIIEDTKTTTATDKTSVAQKSSETIRNNGRTNLSVLVGYSGLRGPTDHLAVGGHVTHSVFGPITVGGFGLSNLTFGGSLGIQF